MTALRFFAGFFALIAINSAVRGDDNERMLTRCRDAKLIVVGRITKVHSCEHPRGIPGVGTVATATIKVERHLKGTSDAETIEIQFQCESNLDLEPDDEDVIWFIRDKMDDGRHAVRDWKWGTSSARHIDWALGLVDRKTRIPGMPKAEPGKKPISLGLVATDEKGKGATSVRVGSLGDLTLLVQFENHQEGTRAVVPFLYGSDLGLRYPRYELEILDADGKAVPRRPVITCATVGELSKWDIVALEKGEVFRCQILSVQRYSAPNGKYRVRVLYTAKQDATISVRPTRELDAQLSAALKTVWEGTLESNWIEVEVGGGLPNHKP
jgi:hypothetical protein